MIKNIVEQLKEIQNKFESMESALESVMVSLIIHEIEHGSLKNKDAGRPMYNLCYGDLDIDIFVYWIYESMSEHAKIEDCEIEEIEVKGKYFEVTVYDNDRILADLFYKNLT